MTVSMSGSVCKVVREYGDSRPKDVEGRPYGGRYLPVHPATERKVGDLGRGLRRSGLGPGLRPQRDCALGGRAGGAGLKPCAKPIWQEDVGSAEGFKMTEKQKNRLRAALTGTGSFRGWIGKKYLTARLLNGYLTWSFGRKGRAGGGGCPNLEEGLERIERQHRGVCIV